MRRTLALPELLGLDAQDHFGQSSVLQNRPLGIEPRVLRGVYSMEPVDGCASLSPGLAAPTAEKRKLVEIET